ncbi:hypothetical protein SAMN04487905_11086 [Actinopolyspora xinjiangensis]|uniref:Uncharacterized protein n=1 Tax=Actinopolyspora xinjiangensis TaxID=405564 RepID=A0A1H0W0Y3_9ACTN|nr:hypothetical protein [Actinopolyspora xinjiangensis]SDP84173.1 hypothetical protein SAMN04487905_11086 [Actinopolyspora xinjiangensis]
MRSRTGAGVAVTLLFALVLAGCSGASGHRPAVRVGYPFDGVTRFSEAERRVLHDAEERLVAECMNSRGFDYEPSERGGEESGADNPYGLLTPERAADDGYGMTMRAVRNSSVGKDEARTKRSESPERDRALTGTEENRKTITTETGTELTFATDGCLHEARTEVYGKSWDRAFYTMQDLSNEVIRGVTGSAEFSEAQRRWSECMSSAGHEYETLQGPLRTIREKLDEQGPTEEIAGLELSLAEQDARCQRRVELAETTREVQRVEEEKALEGHRARLKELRRLRRAALNSARSVMADE